MGVSVFNLKNRKCLIYDYGIFLPLAIELSKAFKETFYFNPYQSEFAKPEKAMLSAGIETLTNVADFELTLMELDKSRDLICFLDVGEGGKQELYRSLGYRVFGMGYEVEMLEQNRYKFKKFLEGIGMPAGKEGVDWKHLIGMPDLSEELGKDPDWWVKLNTFRGLTETFYAGTNMEFRMKMLDHLAGAYGEKIKVKGKDFGLEFIIERTVEGKEFGDDFFVGKGIHYSKGLFGIEHKDTSYSCKIVNYEDIPKPMKDIQDAMEPFFKKNNANGMYSTEMRVKEKLNIHFGDMTSRPGSPPSEIVCKAYKNFPEAVFASASGENINLEEKKPYWASVVLSSEWCKKEASVIKFADKIADKVCLRNVCKVDGLFKYIPTGDTGMMGCAIGSGDSLEEAQSEALEVAGQVEADGIYFDKDTFDNMDETIEYGRKIGLYGRF
jgi:hypothetical protein